MRKLVMSVFGIGLGIFLLWLLFRSTDWSAVAASIRRIDWKWFALAQVPLLLSFPARVQRWTYIVRATDPVSFRNLFSATQIGFLANFTLPGRAGEAIRALTLTRLTRIGFSKSLAFVALDRVTDLFGLMAVIGVSIVAFSPTEEVLIPADTFGTAGPIVFGTNEIRLGAVFTGLFLVATLSVFALLYFRRDDFLAVSRAILGRVSRRLAEVAGRVLNLFADGLSVFRSPLEMAKSIAWSLVTWSLFLVSMSCLLVAFGIDFPWYTPFVVQAILAVFIAAPNTPGFVGQFHVPIVLGLIFTIPEIDSNTAKAFAIVYHLIQLPGVFVLGFGCLLTERMNLLQLQSEGEELSRVGESDAGGE